MWLEIVRLLAINLAYLLVGVVAFAGFGWVTQAPRTWYRLGVAYPFGLVLVVVPASYLALVGIPVVWGAIMSAGVVVVYTLTRRWPLQLAERPSLALHAPRSVDGIVAVSLTLVLGVLLLYAARTFATRPLVEWDSWVIWGSKARLLYDDPTAAAAALRSGSYGQPTYPLALPTLEALGFSAIGRFDGTIIALQFLFLAVGFPAALWSLTRNRGRGWLAALTALVIVGAPQMMFQLLTRYADVPLGLFVGLGLTAGAAWLLASPRETWLLGCFVAFLGLAGLTKNEGLLFAVAGIVALAAGSLVHRNHERLTRAAVAAAALLAVIVPWRLYCSAYGLSTQTYRLGNAASPSYLRAHADRVGPTARELWTQLTATENWGLLTWAILLALVVTLTARRWPQLVFAGTWLALASGGLVLTYWIDTLPTSSHLTNSSYRTIVSLLIGGAAMTPLLVLPRPADDRSDP